jgi:CDP-glycerol glycerophosphotransferase (TagB/SpsB family)
MCLNPCGKNGRYYAAMKRYLLFGNLPYALPILRPLQAAVRAQGGEARWFFHGDGAQYLRPDETQLASAREVVAFAPGAVIVPGNWVPHFFPGVKVQVFHGFGTLGKKNAHKVRGLFDLYCTHGDSNTPQMREQQRRAPHFAVTETGWPKLDPLFRDFGEPCPAYLGAVKGGGKPVVLYAPTFTRYLTSAPALFDTIQALVGEGRWHFLFNLHPKLEPAWVDKYRALCGEHATWVQSPDALWALKCADAMLSDTSSIVWEFLLLGKPAVTLRNGEPGPYLLDVREPAEVPAALERALSGRAPLDEIERFGRAIHPARDGRSSERVLAAIDAFAAGQLGAPGAKPFNAWRKLQMRWKLGYWGT